MKPPFLIEGSGGGKSGSGGGEAPNTIKSESIAKVLDLICSGQIFGFVNALDPLKSIYYNKLPLKNSDDTLNYTGAQIEYVLGTMDQDPILGFESVEATEEVGVEATYSIYPSATITDSLTDELICSISIPALTKTNSKTGALEGNWVSFEWQVKGASDATWTTVAYDSVQEKFTSTNVFDYFVDISGRTFPVSVRLKRITQDSTTVSDQRSTFFASYTTIINKKFSYPGSALIAHTLPARQFGGSIPDRGAEIYGQLCLIPSNYNPWTRVYTGIWDGTFVEGWTNNPAYVLLSCLVNTDWGLGEYVSLADVDKNALYAIGQYCDELVADGFGGTEPRYTFNAYIQTQENAATVIQSISSQFHGMTLAATSKILFTQDSPSDPVALVTNANVLGGEFTYEGVSASSRKSAYMVEWNNPDKLYEKDFEFVEDPELIATFGWKMDRLPLLGCTSRGQARRAGRWQIFTNKFQTRMVSYRASLDHGFLLPGNIIRLADNKQSTYRYGGRVVSATTTSITLDSTTTLESGKTYTIYWVNPSGTISSATVTNAASTTSTITFSAISSGLVPAAESIFLISSTEEKLYRVLATREVGGREPYVEVMCAQHFDGKYDLIEGTDALEATPSFVINSAQPIYPPSNAAFVKSTAYVAGLPQTSLQITFDASPSARAQYYTVLYRYNYGPWQKTDTYTTTVNLPWNGTGRYQVSITAKGIGDQQDAVSIPLAHEQVLIDERGLDKATISGLALDNGITSTTFGGGTAKFKWGVGVPASYTNDFWEDPFFRDFEIQVRTTGNVVKGTYYTRSPFFEFTSERNSEANAGIPLRSFKFRVRIRDTFGSETDSDWSELTVSNPAPATPTGVTVTPVVSGLQIKVTPPTDLDWKGTLLWTSSSPGITLPGTPKDLGQTTSFSIEATAGATVYYRIAFYDEFGKDTLNATTEASAVAGSVTSTELAAGSVLPSKLQQIDTQNLVLDPFLSDTSYYAAQNSCTIDSSSDVTTTLGLPKAFKTVPGDGVIGSTAYIVGAPTSSNYWVPIEQSASFLATAQTLAKAGFNGRVRIRVFWYKQDKVTAASTASSDVNGTNYGSSPAAVDTLQTLVGILTPPSDAAWARVTAHFTSSSTLARAGFAYIGNLRFLRATTSNSIADLAITSGKLADLAVVAGKIGSSAVGSTEIALGAVIASKIGNLQVGNAALADLAVTGGKIALNTITAANIFAGTITANELAAGAIIASKIALTDTTNMVLDPNYNDSAYWANNSGWTIGSTDATAIAALTVPKGVKTPVGNGTTSQSSAYLSIVSGSQIPVEPGKSIRLFAKTFVKAGFTGRISISAVWYQADGVTPSTSATNWGLQGTDYRTVAAASDTPSTLEGQKVVPNDTYYVRFQHVVEWSTTQNNAQYGFIAMPRMHRAVSAELIVDGTITAAKILAGTITATQIASGTITGTNIAAGTITAGLIAASAITASKLALTDGSNMVVDNDFLDSSYWSYSTGTGAVFGSTDTIITSTLGAKRGYKTPNGDGTLTGTFYTCQNTQSQFPIMVEPGKSYRISCKVAASNGTTMRGYIQLNWYKQDGSSASTATSGINGLDFRTVAAVGTQSMTIDGLVVAPSDAYYAAFVMVAQQSTTLTNAGNIFFALPRMNRAISAELIVDGTITAAKILAGTITATQIASATITGANIAGGTITAANILAGTITATQIASGTITGTNIAGGTITATNLAAQAITASKILLVDTQNLIIDPYIYDTSYWARNIGSLDSSSDVTTTMNLPFAHKSDSGNGTTSQAASLFGQVGTNYRPTVEPGKVYRVAARTLVKSGFTGMVSFRVYWYALDNTTIVGTTDVNSTNFRSVAAGSDQVIEIDGQVTAPSNAVRARPQAVVTWSTTLNNAGSAYMGNMRMTRAASAELIVDGTITASKINVTNLAAISANLGDITAGSLSLTSAGYVVYHGAGFGASSDLIMWFGSSGTAKASATKTNGIFALATDGKVYFGSAEITSNATSAPVTSAVFTKSATSGTFSTSGTTATTLATIDANSVPASGILKIVNCALATGTYTLSSGTSWFGNVLVTEQLQSGGTEYTLATIPVEIQDTGGGFFDIIYNAGQELSSILPIVATQNVSGNSRYRLKIQRTSGTNNINSGPAAFSNNFVIERTPA